MNLHTLTATPRVEQLRDWMAHRHNGHTFRVQGDKIFVRLAQDPEWELGSIDYWFTCMDKDKVLKP